MYLIQAAQEHFIADDKNAVERRRHKVLYPVVLCTVTNKIGQEWNPLFQQFKPLLTSSDTEQHNFHSCFNRIPPFLHHHRGSHLIHSENLDPLTAQPLIKLSSPVLHEAARGDHEDTLHDRFPPVRSLFKQSPGQCNTLESLSQTHLIGQNGSRTTSSPETHKPRCSLTLNWLNGNVTEWKLFYLIPMTHS